VGSLFGVGYEAEKLQRLLARVLKLVTLVGKNKNYIASFERQCCFAVEKLAFPVQYEDFVFPGMGVKGTDAVGRHLKEAHGKVVGTYLLGD
jgi:hypothetical protein